MIFCTPPLRLVVELERRALLGTLATAAGERAILAALSRGSLRASELVERTGLSWNEVDDCLHALVVAGKVESYSVQFDPFQRFRRVVNSGHRQV